MSGTTGSESNSEPTTMGAARPVVGAEALGWSGVRRDYPGAARSLATMVLIAPAIGVLVVAVVLAVVVQLLGGPGLLLGAVVLVAGLVAAFLWGRSKVSNARAAVLATLGARPADATRDARVFNLVDGLRDQIGVAAPEVLVLEDPARNALATADAEGSAIVLTRGLIDDLGRIELEGVVAHLLASIRCGAAAAGSLGVRVYGAAMADGRGRAWWASVAGRHARMEIDFAAVAATRYPPGLCSALDHVGEGSFTPEGYRPSTAHLWLVPDGGPDDDSVDALRWRVAALGEL